MTLRRDARYIRVREDFYETTVRPSGIEDASLISGNDAYSIGGGPESALNLELSLTVEETNKVLVHGWLSTSGTSSTFDERLYVERDTVEIGDSRFTYDGTAAAVGDSFVGFYVATVFLFEELSSGEYTYNFKFDNPSSLNARIHGCLIVV